SLVFRDFPSNKRSQRSGDASTLYQACACNNRISLRNVLHRGVTKDEVMELDNNGMNGLMVACFKGFVDMVHELHNCPYLDINHQDSEGNTALMIASQAGHINTVMYLLNYYPGINTEMKDCRGFTALIKATMTGRSDVVAALLMAGADIDEVDSTRGACAHDWALKTGRFEVIHRLRRLMARPRAEQFCESYVPEWPELKEKVAKATAQKSPAEKFTLRIKNTFGFSFPRDPKDDGVMDHMVRMTTSIHSPLVSTGCRPLCPASPPEMGRRRLTVQELMRKHPHKELEERSPPPLLPGFVSECLHKPRQQAAVLLVFWVKSVQDTFPLSSGSRAESKAAKRERTYKHWKRAQGTRSYFSFLSPNVSFYSSFFLLST
uniref:Ankyrin repeat domain 33Ab n=1 Tax=Kryptolebias marmoratus TaxID=37003 RepID=A0A3Q3GRW3_KRYMA